MERKNLSFGEGEKCKRLHPYSFDVCLYHFGCPDGIGGAFPFWRINRSRYEITTLLKTKVPLPKVLPFDIKGVKHNEPYPEELIREKNVVIVDFSYKRDVIKEMCRNATLVYILDHHETARRELEGLEKEFDNFGYIFDLDRSGAQIAWDWCYPDIPRPWFIEIIADRDLWKWEIPNAKEIGKALYHFEWYNWEKMEELTNNLKDTPALIKKFTEQGRILLDIDTKDISYAVGTSKLCEFQGHRIRLSTCHPSLRSEVGNAAANMYDCDFAATWRYDVSTDQWWISLRGSKNCCIQLNQITEKFGGGGHPKACGFTIHGVDSNEWRRADTEKRSKMAHGTIRDYFKLI